MKVTADTNVLVRLIVDDNPSQASAARAELDAADVVAIGNAVLCEMSWVLGRIYRYSAQEMAIAIRGFADTSRVALNREAVEAGLAMLDSGGDFADGVIAFEGRQLGGETFVSFDKQAVKLLQTTGQEARQL
jgi:predicted nucleic-acid-binding protein